MTSSNTESGKQANQPPQNPKKYRVLVLMLLALLLLWLFQWRLNEYKHEQLEKARGADSLAAESRRTADSLAGLQNQALLDSLRVSDSLRMADSLRAVDSMRYADSLRELEARKGRATGHFAIDSQALAQRRADSLRNADSLARKKHLQDSLRAEADRAAARAADSLPPTPSLLPPPGRYYEKIALQVDCGESRCQTEISLGDSLHSRDGSVPVAFATSGSVYYRATDSVGNRSAWLSGSYDMAADNRCPANSYPVPVKGKLVCVDAYEYPNQHGQKPRDMVTQETASRLCADAGKRLCSIEEWQAACRGKDNLKYVYGNRYDQNKCVTAAREAVRSGYSAQCRSWWGMYDMGGNLWEWTSSPAPQRSNLFLVAGGSWNTQNASSCTETKFSFYPQNEYAFVGFRCCSDSR